MTYSVHKVDSGTFQVVDDATKTEFCVCSAYDGEKLHPQKRAYEIAKALSVACTGARKAGR